MREIIFFNERYDYSNEFYNWFTRARIWVLMYNDSSNPESMILSDCIYLN